MAPLSTTPDRLRDALLRTRGNITRAAEYLEISKTYGMILVRRFALAAWARELRRLAGAAATGRPRNI
jgi:hypothetical protein